MPISRDVTFRCPKCGYSFTKTIGDVINPMDLLAICPKCGTKMITGGSKSIIDIIKNIFK